MRKVARHLVVHGVVGAWRDEFGDSAGLAGDLSQRSVKRKRDWSKLRKCSDICHSGGQLFASPFKKLTSVKRSPL
jgi:hypothetical protein